MKQSEEEKLGLYVHIPFCVKKCHYCDFRSLPGCGDLEQERYINALCSEIMDYGNEKGQDTDEIDVNRYSVNTVFVGGGTPSLLSPRLLAKLLSSLGQVFRLDMDSEITLEANPGTLDREKLEAYRALGVNRLSMGVQSFDDGVLQLLGRIHDGQTALENFWQAREAGYQNINLDLMFGIPGQTFTQWEETLEKALALSPEHLSFYSLQIEEETPFYQWFLSGRIQQPSEELDRRMYHFALEKLSKCGYRHYEISNGAKPGFECRHNLKYWSMEDYLGLGLSAHSFIRGVRFCNTLDMEEYQKGQRLAEVHRSDRWDSISDYLFTGLRRTDGISLEDFQQRYGQRFSELYPRELARFLSEGLLCVCGDNLQFTAKGLDFTNTVLRELMKTGGGDECE